MILTQDQLTLENSLRRILPAGVVSCWIPDGYNRAKDIIRDNHGQCFGTHPNVPVLQQSGPNILPDGGLNIWTSETNLTHWDEATPGTSTINREATEKIEGDYSCRLDVNADNSLVYIYQQNRPLTPLKTHIITIWYKNSIAEKTSKFSLRVQGTNICLKEDDTWSVNESFFTLPNSLVWTPYRVPFHAHPDYSSYRFDLRNLSAASSSIYFDNISIEELKPSLINPSVGWVTDGLNDYWDLGTKASLTFLDSGPWSFSHWMNWAGQDIAHVFYAGYSEAPEKFILRYNHNNRFGWRDKNQGYHLFAEDSPTPYIGEWAYLTWVADGNGNLSLFVNRELFGTLTSVPTQLHFTSIGRGYIGTDWTFKGSIALPSIANKALTLQEHSNFGLATKGLFSPRGF